MVYHFVSDCVLGLLDGFIFLDNEPPGEVVDTPCGGGVLVVFEVDDLAADFGDEFVLIVNVHGHEDTGTVFVDLFVGGFGFDKFTGAPDKPKFGIDGRHVGDECAFGIELSEAVKISEMMTIHDRRVWNKEMLCLFAVVHAESEQKENHCKPYFGCKSGCSFGMKRPGRL